MSRTPTARQLEVLTFIRSHQAEQGTAPTIREIAAHLGVSSTNGVAEHLKALAKKGLVTKRPGARGYVPAASAPTPAAVVTSEERAWIRGFAHALAALWRATGDREAVRLARLEGGVAMVAIEDAGAEIDVQAIREALGLDETREAAEVARDPDAGFMLGAHQPKWLSR